MAIYMKVKNVNGNVSSTNYKDWIELQSMEFTVNRNTSMLVGNMKQRTVDWPRFSELEISKVLDNASNNIFQAACKATVWSDVEIHVVSTENDSSAPYAKYQLNDVIVSHGHTTVTGRAKPQEIWKLNYTKLLISYVKRDHSNKVQSSVTSGYDLAEAKSM